MCKFLSGNMVGAKVAIRNELKFIGTDQNQFRRNWEPWSDYQIQNRSYSSRFYPVSLFAYTVLIFLDDGHEL